MAFRIPKRLEAWFPLTKDENGPAVLICDLLPGDLEDIQGACLHVDNQIKNPDTTAREMICKPQFNDLLSLKMKMDRAIKGFREIEDEKGAEMAVTPENIEFLRRNVHNFKEWFQLKLEVLEGMREQQIAVKEKNLLTSPSGSAVSADQTAKPASEPISQADGISQ